MELRHLRSFIVVAETLHFGQSAERIGVSPPTLTAQIQELERALQARLFNRTKRSVALTPAGEAFLAEARATLEQLDRAVHVGRRAGRGQVGRVEIGYVGSAVFSGALQDQVRRFRTQWPDVMVNTNEFPNEKLPTLIEEGRVDVAFIRSPVAHPPSLASHIVARDRFCVALSVDHPLAMHAGKIRPAALAEESFVVPEQVLGLQEVARRGAFTPAVVSTPGTLVAVLAQVALGVGVAIVPSVLIKSVKLPDVVFNELAGPIIHSEVAALYRKHERSQTVRHLIDQVVASAPRR
ncbi:LysR family transcriptional regulator [Chitinasiproducens palmae]|uniref:DNA-binding transcriptional regulator, LysR family n=1 Tax=Chitinasiproducens palmae TaxID=1770053 RepID=A0A1H2PKS5_9BURK|nr:LysR substrate-binding domain-containing protein [Chitinasiproducens palmae]SDV47066.1 DNA-binding transcriptional regulator, LysR family [Chitinasiproducens palmae]